MSHRSSPDVPILAGAPNFRDIGGCASTDGRTVHRGRVFRSQVLASATDQDLEVLRRLDIGAVLDLRGQREARRRNRWPAGTVPRAISIVRHVDTNADEVDPSHWSRWLLDPSFDESRARTAMMNVYRRMPRAHAPHVAALFGLLADRSCRPVLVHCEAGKDRTGFVCAVLLLALGVPMDQVLADYELSNQRYRLDRELLLESLGCDPPGHSLAAQRVMATVDAEFLNAAMDQIRADFGSLGNYLQRGVGVTAEQLNGVRSKLLER